jgi:hypothetical protein
MAAAMRMLGVVCVITLAVGCVDEPVPEPSSEITSALAARVLRGVDRASAFSAREARLLAATHGVRWSGVYIGGACDGGSGWNRHVVQSIHAVTNWQFMPIWVGQQSPAICGAAELTYARGRVDGFAAATAMRAFGWYGSRDIPVALDVEAGAYEYSPAGSTAYVRGWVSAVHQRGYRAYVYSSPYGIVHFHDAGVPIDAAWVASYFYSGFANVRPTDLHQIGARYARHDRAWQYAGDFYVSGVGRVDANTSDLVLAPAPGGTNAAPTAARVEDGQEDDESGEIELEADAMIDSGLATE